MLQVFRHYPPSEKIIETVVSVHHLLASCGKLAGGVTDQLHAFDYWEYADLQLAPSSLTDTNGTGSEGKRLRFDPLAIFTDVERWQFQRK